MATINFQVDTYRYTVYTQLAGSLYRQVLSQ